MPTRTNKSLLPSMYEVQQQHPITILHPEAAQQPRQHLASAECSRCVQLLQQAAQRVCSGSVIGLPAASSQTAAIKQEWMQQPAAPLAEPLSTQVCHSYWCLHGSACQCGTLLCSGRQQGI